MKTTKPIKSKVVVRNFDILLMFSKAPLVRKSKFSFPEKEKTLRTSKAGVYRNLFLTFF